MKKSPLVLNSGRVGQLQTGDWIGAKDNIANSAPAVSNDSSEGYEVSSRWLDIVAQIEYICIDASVGAAVWVQVVGGGGGGTFASQAEAEAGTDQTKYMNPLRTTQNFMSKSVFARNKNLIAQSYTLESGYNASAVGPVVIDVGGEIIISPGSVLAII